MQLDQATAIAERVKMLVGRCPILASINNNTGQEIEK